MRIGLMATIRDEALALPRFFRLLEAFESNCNVDYLFCSFYENDSIDHTPSFWPPGLDLGYCKLNGWVSPGFEVERSFVQSVWQRRATKHAGFGDENLDWLVVIDADLFASSLHILKLIAVLQRDRVAMACKLTSKHPRYFRGSPCYYDS